MKFMNMMNNHEERDSTELIRQAIEEGLINSNLSIKCVCCKAIFPIEYDSCPQCSTDQLSQATKFNMTVTWEWN